MTIAPNKVMLEMLREKWVKVKVFDGTIECARWYGGFSGLYGDTGTDLKWKITLTRSVVERERERVFCTIYNCPYHRQIRLYCWYFTICTRHQISNYMSSSYPLNFHLKTRTRCGHVSADLNSSRRLGMKKLLIAHESQKYATIVVNTFKAYNAFCEWHVINFCNINTR